jgi:hypothetical protein
LDDGFRLGAGAGTDVDPQLLNLWLLFELVGAEQVDRLASDRTSDALPSMHPDHLPDRNDAVMSSDRAEVE